MEAYFFNKEVVVDALYFRDNGTLASYPKHMVVDDQDITFTESGLQYVVRRGKQMLQMFDMTDGQQKYQLELNPEEQRWKLIHVAPLGVA